MPTYAIQAATHCRTQAHHQWGSCNGEPTRLGTTEDRSQEQPEARHGNDEPRDAVEETGLQEVHPQELPEWSTDEIQQPVAATTGVFLASRDRGEGVDRAEMVRERAVRVVEQIAAQAHDGNRCAAFAGDDHSHRGFRPSAA